MKREIIQTADGSNTIYIPEMDENYHSSHGALQEALHVFIKNGLELKKSFSAFRDKNIIRILIMPFLLFGCLEYPVTDNYYYGEFDSGNVTLFLYDSSVSGESDYIELEFFDNKKSLPEFNNVQFYLENKCCEIKRDTSERTMNYYEFNVDNVDLLFNKNKTIIIDLKNDNKFVKRIILNRKQEKRMKSISGH